MDGMIFLGNIKGEKGDTGKGLTILDFYETVEELNALVTNPSVGDAYGVGEAEPYDIYIYSQRKGWVNNGPFKGDKGDKGDTGASSYIGVDSKTINVDVSNDGVSVYKLSPTSPITIYVGEEQEHNLNFEGNHNIPAPFDTGMYFALYDENDELLDEFPLGIAFKQQYLFSIGVKPAGEVSVSWYRIYLKEWDSTFTVTLTRDTGSPAISAEVKDGSIGMSKLDDEVKGILSQLMEKLS